MTTAPSLNLDKLRNIVQKFGAGAFSPAQVAHEYGNGEAAPTDEVTAQFTEALQRHAVVLGIEPAPGTALWQMR